MLTGSSSSWCATRSSRCSGDCAGYWIGSFKIGAFRPGVRSLGALFAGLFVGQFAHVPVSGMTKSFLFLLFLFGIGYSVGPQFMQALKRDGLKPVLLALVVSLTALPLQFSLPSS